MNTSLTFEVLLYLNSYYFGLFAVCEIGMNIVKYVNFNDEHHFSTDFGILMAVCVIEVFRVILARRGNLTEKSMYAHYNNESTYKFKNIYFRLASGAGNNVNDSVSAWSGLLDDMAKRGFKIRVYYLYHPTRTVRFRNYYGYLMPFPML